LEAAMNHEDSQPDKPTSDGFSEANHPIPPSANQGRVEPLPRMLPDFSLPSLRVDDIASEVPWWGWAARFSNGNGIAVYWEKLGAGCGMAVGIPLFCGILTSFGFSEWTLLVALLLACIVSASGFVGGILLGKWLSEEEDDLARARFRAALPNPPPKGSTPLCESGNRWIQTDTGSFSHTTDEGDRVAGR
jgi:hypothetical protein